jgi:hypothetical protein
MRTTISIANELLVEAKLRARESVMTLGQIMEAALRRELVSHDTGENPPPVPVFRGGSGPRPGIDLTSNRAIHEKLRLNSLPAKPKIPPR